MTSPDSSVETRAQALFALGRQAHHARIDRRWRWALAAQLPIALAAVPWLSARAAGPPAVAPGVSIALTVGLVLLAIVAASLRPGATATRHLTSAAQVSLSALLIAVGGGGSMLHLYAAGSLALVALYRDWRLVPGASLLVVAAHVAIALPAGADGSLAAIVGRHAAWLALADVCLVFVILRAAGEARASAREGAVVEEAERARAGQIARLAEAEQQSSTMLRGALDAIVSMDEHGGVVEFNPAAERLFGYRREDVIGRELRSLIVPPALREAHRAGVERYFRTGESRLIDRRIEVLGWRADGTEVPIELSLTDVRMPGRPPMVTALIRDMTERVRAEAALRDARDVAEQVNRAKTEFVANIGHEMRTPINALLGVVEVMRAGDRTGEHGEALRMMEASARQLLHVINDLLDFSQLEAGHLKLEPGQLAVAALAHELSSTFAPRAAAKGLAFTVTVAPAVPAAIEADRARIAQVLRHLLDNALKFTHRGRIAVDVALGAGADAGGIVFTVTDTGIGIPADRQAAIFEAFTQADGSATRQFGGTGLGLTLAAQLAGLMGGRLALTSAEGAGSTFRFVVPFVHAAPGSRGGEGVSGVVRERLGGDEALVGELVRIFLASCPEQMDGLRAAVTAGQPDQIRRRAQAIRGAVAFLADEGAVDAAVRVEAAADTLGEPLVQAMRGLEATLADLEARLVHLRENTGA